jgi:hypothetical protein
MATTTSHEPHRFARKLALDFKTAHPSWTHQMISDQVVADTPGPLRGIRTPREV